MTMKVKEKKLKSKDLAEFLMKIPDLEVWVRDRDYDLLPANHPCVIGMIKDGYYRESEDAGAKKVVVL